MKKIVILQRIIPHYRVPFFEGLYHVLASKGIQLYVVYGQEYPGQVPIGSTLYHEWAIKINNRYWRCLGKEFVLQPAVSHLVDADLVVVEQANRLLLNYWLLVKRKFTSQKLAFWGHGKNFQSQSKLGLAERWKQKISIEVDWWFAYTSQSASIVKQLGYSPHRITIVQNSIDTSALSAVRRVLTGKEIEEVKYKLGIHSDNVTIFCGGMYNEKKIDFLLQACDSIRLAVSDFHVIFVGSGPDEEKVFSFAETRPWVHYLGSVTGEERVPLFLISKLVLMPGLVGLAVLDSFALSTPMISTDIPIHSPEFEYLQNNKNGLVTKHDLAEYSDAVSSLLLDEPRRLQLVKGCEKSAREYSIYKMITNFSEGVVSALH